MLRKTIYDEYFEWLCNLVCEDRYPDTISYERLLRSLHDKEFRYVMMRDDSREADGIDLRYRFGHYYNKPCSVLEMMVGLSIRCEDYMDDPSYGDRTAQWFWGMIANLGLGSMTDDRFDETYVDSVLERFLDREYEPDGRGGLFRIRNCKCDLRGMEIWQQLCWYLDTIT